MRPEIFFLFGLGVTYTVAYRTTRNILVDLAASHASRRILQQSPGRRYRAALGIYRGVRGRKLVDDLIDRMNPASRRSAGAAFDNKAAMPNERIAAVRAPTLIFLATDDTLQVYRNAEFAAATVPGARLVGFERGHLLLSVEQSVIRTMTQRHILDHAWHDLLGGSGAVDGRGLTRPGQNSRS